jgi:uncharacterized protein YjlB
MASLNLSRSIKKAVLRMFCNTRKNPSLTTLIYAKIIGGDSCTYTQTSVNGAGWYEWDLTEMMRTPDGLERFTICLFAGYDDYYFTKTFCTQASSYPISLEIATYQDKETSTYEYKEDCLSASDWRYSKWLNCSVYKNYVYHIYNAGTSDVTITLNISPNQEYSAEGSPTYTVKPGELIVVDPWKYSFYIRVAFKNVTECNDNLITLWFQALK